MMARGIRRDEAGQIGGVEGVVFGVLVFVFGTLVVANAWGVIDAKLAASAAAREATRSYVEQAGTADDPLGAARHAADEALRAHGRSPERGDLVASSAVLRRCAPVTMKVLYRVPLVTLPLIGRFGSGFTVSASHTEVVDPLRSGLTDTDVCGAMS